MLNRKFILAVLWVMTGIALLTSCGRRPLQIGPAVLSPNPALSPASGLTLVSLARFRATTGQVAHGDIDLVLDFPSDVRAYVRVNILRFDAQASSQAPACNLGERVRVFTAPFANSRWTDSTNAPSSRQYQYLACAVDGQNQTAALQTETVRSLDKHPPPPLTAFSAATGTQADGEITLSWSYAADSTDLFKIKLIRIPGIVAPATCGVGVIVATLVRPFPTVGTFNDQTGSRLGEPFSYRACLEDSVENLTNTNKVESVSARDTTRPGRLRVFTGQTGLNQGEVNLTLNFDPIQVLDYARVSIRSQVGQTPPTCASGTVIATLAPPFIDSIYVDRTSAFFGEPFSYRACITDRAENLTFDDAVAGIVSRDRISPPALASFNAQTGAGARQIRIEIGYPEDVRDYLQVTIRRQSGASPPANCAEGTLVKTFENITETLFIDTGVASAIEPAIYSYRACVFDRSGNSTSSTRLNVTARAQCVQTGTQTMNVSQAPAAHLDPLFYFHLGARTSAAPIEVFRGIAMRSTDRLTLTSSLGVSIRRVYESGYVLASEICPNSWKLYFKRGNDSLIDATLAGASLGLYQSGQSVPENALTAWIGFHDDDPSFETYEDNEGNRTRTSGAPSTGGCNFTFRLDQVSCE